MKHTSILSRFSISTALDSTPATSHLDPRSPLPYFTYTLLSSQKGFEKPSQVMLCFFQLPSPTGPLTSFCLSPPLPSPTTIATGGFPLYKGTKPPPPRGLGYGCSHFASSFTCFSQGWPALVPQTWQTSPPP